MNSKSFIFSSFVGFGVLFCHQALAIAPIEKLSLKNLTAEFKEGDSVSKSYQLMLKDPASLSAKNIDELYKKNQNIYNKFSRSTLASNPFVRGEIEDEKILTGLMQMVQLSSLKMQVEAERKKYLRVKEEAALWLLFAADLPYEEASLVGLRLAAVVRALILDELENLEKKYGDVFLKDPLWLEWIKSVRSPWPIDRVILSEGRRSLNNASMKIAERLAAALQKNTYQSADVILDQVTGGKADSMKPFREMWRTQEVDQMKTEINRIQAMRLRWAAIQYFVKTKVMATDVQQIVQKKILDQAPIDYKTGVPMSLAQAALHK